MPKIFSLRESFSLHLGIPKMLSGPGYLVSLPCDSIWYLTWSSYRLTKSGSYRKNVFHHRAVVDDYLILTSFLERIPNVRRVTCVWLCPKGNLGMIPTWSPKSEPRGTWGQVLFLAGRVRSAPFIFYCERTWSLVAEEPVKTRRGRKRISPIYELQVKEKKTDILTGYNGTMSHRSTTYRSRSLKSSPLNDWKVCDKLLHQTLLLNFFNDLIGSCKSTALDISLWELWQNPIVLERENFKIITYPQLVFWSFLVLKPLDFDIVLTVKCQGL